MPKHLSPGQPKTKRLTRRDTSPNEYTISIKRTSPSPSPPGATPTDIPQRRLNEFEPLPTLFSPSHFKFLSPTIHEGDPGFEPEDLIGKILPSTSQEGTSQTNSPVNRRYKLGSSPNQLSKLLLGTTPKQPTKFSIGQAPLSISRDADERRPWHLPLKITRVLGVGSFAVVYEAESEWEQAGDDDLAGVVFAVKLLLKQSFVQQDLSEMQRIEVESLNRLYEHPNVTHLYRTLHLGSSLTFLVMEYCPFDLYEAISATETGFTEEESRRIIRQIAEIVKFAQDHGVYHRDLKPENVLIDEEGNARLGDWGLAHLAPATSKDKKGWDYCDKCVGSLRYQAPELLREDCTGYSPSKSDVWSLGCMFLNCIRGRSPWQEATEEGDDGFRRWKLGGSHAEHSIKHGFRLTDAGYHFVQKLLNVDPQERVTIEQVLELLKNPAPFCRTEESWHERRKSQHEYYYTQQKRNFETLTSLKSSPGSDEEVVISVANSIGSRAMSWSDMDEMDYASVPVFSAPGDWANQDFGGRRQSVDSIDLPELVQSNGNHHLVDDDYPTPLAIRPPPNPLISPKAVVGDEVFYFDQHEDTPDHSNPATPTATSFVPIVRSPNRRRSSIDLPVFKTGLEEKSQPFSLHASFAGLKMSGNDSYISDSLVFNANLGNDLLHADPSYHADDEGDLSTGESEESVGVIGRVRVAG